MSGKEEIWTQASAKEALDALRPTIEEGIALGASREKLRAALVKFGLNIPSAYFKRWLAESGLKTRKQTRFAERKEKRIGEVAELAKGSGLLSHLGGNPCGSSNLPLSATRNIP